MLKWDIKDSGTCSNNNMICPVANQMVNVLTIKKVNWLFYQYLIVCSFFLCLHFTEFDIIIKNIPIGYWGKIIVNSPQVQIIV